MKCHLVSMCFDSPCPFVVSVRLIDPRLSPRRPNGSSCGKNTPASQFFIHMACCAPRANEIYSASVDDNATTACRFADQQTGAPPMKKMYPDVDLRVSTHPAQSESTNP